MVLKVRYAFRLKRTVLISGAVLFCVVRFGNAVSV